MNRLTRSCVLELTNAISQLEPVKPLIIAGNQHYFSVGADLDEIAALRGADAFELAKAGQQLMSLIDNSPAPAYAAISGYCMGGGLDLALACDFRICAANAVFGHRGAALGLITGWGGTQRLPRAVGPSRAMQMFAATEKLGAAEALDIGLVSEIAPDPLARCIELAEECVNAKNTKPDSR